MTHPRRIARPARAIPFFLRLASSFFPLWDRTAHAHARTHTHARTHARAHTHARTRAHARAHSCESELELLATLDGFTETELCRQIDAVQVSHSMALR